MRVGVHQHIVLVMGAWLFESKEATPICYI